MSSAELLHEWAWLIAVFLSVAFAGLAIGLRRLQAHQAYKRAHAAGSETPSDIRETFLRKRRNFLILLAFVLSFVLTVLLLKLYSALAP